MIEFGISKHVLEKITEFSVLFGRSVDEFIVSSVKVHLCEWSLNKDIFINGIGLEMSESDVDLIINLPDEVMDKLWEFSDYHDESIYDTIQGMVNNTVSFLEYNWSGKSDKNDLLLTDDEKVDKLEEIHKEDEGMCWNSNFSWSTLAPS